MYRHKVSLHAIAAKMMKENPIFSEFTVLRAHLVVRGLKPRYCLAMQHTFINWVHRHIHMVYKGNHVLNYTWNMRCASRTSHTCNYIFNTALVNTSL